MAIAITSVAHADPTPASATQALSPAKSATSSQKSTKPQASPADTVQISAAAQTALQEALEVPAQTAKEARNGDHQAQRLFAREAASQKP
jgi:hypothetical protein